MEYRTYQFYDKTLKFIITKNLTSFFLFFGINCLPFFPIPNEIIDSKLNKSLLDFPVLTLNGIASIEFQLKTNESDAKRFLRYVIQLYEKYDLSVYSIVIDFKIAKDKSKAFYINNKDQLTIHFKSLTARNPDKIINTIRYKIENNTRLTGIDIVGLLLLPLMDFKRKTELLREATDILFLLNDNIVSIEKIREIADVLFNYAEYWEDNETLIKLGKGYEMDEEFCADAIKRYGELIREETAEKVRKETAEKVRKETAEKVRKETAEKVRKETEERIAREMIDDGYEVEDIAKISHLDLAAINTLILMK